MPIDQSIQFVRSVQVPTPAVGQEWSIACPGEAIWRVLMLRFRFVTSAVVDNRIVSLRVDDTTDAFLQLPSSNVETANSDQQYSSFPGAQAASLVATAWILPMPTDGIVLLPGFRLRSETRLIDVGDQYSAIRMLVEQYPTGPQKRATPTVPSFVTDKA